MIVILKGVSQPVQIQIPFSGANAERVCEHRKDILIDRYIIKSAKVFDAYCINTIYQENLL
jgi:hypothetical protein